MKGIQFFVIWLICFTKVENKESCDFTFSLKDGLVTIHYLDIQQPSDAKDECISPSTTITENENYGRVYTLISSNLREGVSVLHRRTVTDFPHLVHIDMVNNRIKEIKQGAFSNLSEVENINLSNNLIDTIEDSAFFKTDYLRSLDLSTNKLKNVTFLWFNNASNLKKLNISRNSISDLGSSLRSATNLEILDSSRNSIFKIDESTFSELSSLKILDLAYNFIHSFHSNTFSTTKKLRLLNLFNNDLTYIPTDVLESLIPLHEIIILYNPIPCDCYQNISKWMAKKGILLNKSLQCSNIDISDIPVCVTTEGKNCNSANLNLYPILHANRQEFKCYLKVQ